MEKIVSPVRIIEHTNQSLNYTVNGVKWIPHSARFISFGTAPIGTGIMQIYHFKGENDNSSKVVLKKQEEIQYSYRLKCACFGFSPSPSRNMATGSLDGYLSFWNLDKAKTPLHTIKAHKETIYCVDGAGVNYGTPEVVTCGQDGCVKVWDTREKKKPVSSLEPESVIQECWAVAFGGSYDDENRTVCCGYANGDLKFFDLRTNEISFETNLRSGIVSIEFDDKETKFNSLLVTTLEGNIFKFDLLTFNEHYGGYAKIQQKFEDKSSVWCGRHLPQNNDLFLTGHGNGMVYLSKYHYPEERVLGKGKERRGVKGRIEIVNDLYLSSQPITTIDWNQHKCGLAVCSAFDQKIRTLFCTKLHTL